MDAVRHADVESFWQVTEPLYRADPVRHTVALTVLSRLRGHQPFGDDPPLLLTVHDDGRLLGAVLRTPPHFLLVSGLPAALAAWAADAIAHHDPDLPGVVGPRPQARAFAAAWSARTGHRAAAGRADRLYRLGELSRPGGVPGAQRIAAEPDVPLLAQWFLRFADEATGGLRDPHGAAESVRRAMAAGSADLLWEVAGQPVAWARASAVTAGMARIGPVYTPPEQRGRGYGAAVTAAAARWALDSGADHVVLFADAANATSNGVYQRIGFRPVLEAAEIGFEPGEPLRSGS